MTVVVDELITSLSYSAGPSDAFGWVTGVDVSNAQNPEACDWITAAAAGVEFAWVKGSEGRRDANPHVDPSAAAHARSIEDSPVVGGMYHVGRPDNRFKDSSDGYANGQQEGRFAAETAFELGLVHGGALPIVLDLEKYTGKDDNGKPIATTEQREDYVRGLVDTVEALTRVTPLVYTGKTYWGYQMSDALAVELRARGVLLWLVDYQPATVLDPEDTIEGWPWAIWQWSGGKDFAYAPPIPGLPSPIDVNRYRGTIEELGALVL